jgi:hypothetical protein
MKSCPDELQAFWSNMSQTSGGSSSSSISRTDVPSSAVPGHIAAASLSAAAAARLILDGRLSLTHHERSIVCAALAVQLSPASHLLADVPFSCPFTAPSAAELIIRVLAADSSQIPVPATQRDLLLAAVAEYALHLTQTSASSSSPAPCRRTADNSSRR